MNTIQDDDVAVDLARFKQATAEMNSGNRDEALWYKAFAESSGSEQATKTAYIRLRVEELRNAAIATTAESSPSAKSEQPARTVSPAPVLTEDTTPPQRTCHFEVDGFPFGLQKKSLEISPDGIRSDGAFIATQDVLSITISFTQNSINGVKKGTSHTLEVSSHDKNISIKLYDKLDGAANEKLFHEIKDAVMEFAGKSLLRRMAETITKGGKISIGDAEFTLQGAWLADRTLLIFKSAPVLVPYNRLWFSLGGGKVCLSDSQNRKNSATFSLLSTKNACMVGPLYNLLINESA